MRARARTLIEREIARAERSRQARDDKTLHASALMRKFEEAYEEVHRCVPVVEYSNGWYALHLGRQGLKRMREAELIAKTNALWAAMHEKELDIPEDSL